MTKFEEVVEKNNGYFVGGKVRMRSKSLVYVIARK
jgi:hypothetical protein